MKKKSNFIMVKGDFAHAYLCLENFASIYEDGEETVAEMQSILCRVFMEEHKSVLNHTTAHQIIDETNVRGAGRKSATSKTDKEKIRQMKNDGVSVQDIAEQFKISVRTVYSICR